MNQKPHKFAKYNEEFKFNKDAFNDVIGDPFGIPEPVQGHYMKLQQRSSIQVSKNEFDMGKATRNTAQPNVIDFVCDVDRIVNAGLVELGLRLTDFEETYIIESTEDTFTAKERMQIEQKIGKLFRSHKLSPVSKYFTTIRQQSVRAAKERNHRNA